MREVAATEKLLRRIEWVSGAMLVSFTGGAWLTFSFQTAMAVLLGCATAIGSFQIMKWQLRRALEKPGKLPSRAGLFASYYIRFLATIFFVFLVIYYGWAAPIPFLVGLSVIVMSIVLVGGLEFVLMKGDS
ncbi:MAG: ATP synthase subunit I [Syntrophobacteraceae bacterium]